MGSSRLVLGSREAEQGLSTMCGFVGAYGAETDRSEIDVALRAIAYRGPDASSYTEQGRMQVGCCRLAIVPPLEEPALHTTLNGSILALNGELLGLREPSGTQAGTPAETDTAALGRALDHDGSQVLSSLGGLFAICYHDGRRLLLARDRFGIKPLYYARYRRGYVFASEMKALLTLPGFSRSPDPDVLSAFALVGHNVFPGRTPFDAIRSVTPGHAVELDANGSTREWSFASVPEVPAAGDGNRPDADELTEAVADLVAASVRRSMHHDPHPKALFFSGGIDSTLLLKLGVEEGDLQPFVLSDRADADDLIEARRITNALGVPLVEHQVDECSLARELVHYAWHFEHPIAGGAFDLLGGAAFHALARRIGADHRIAFCGEGADELFLGYHRFHMEPSLLVESLAANAAVASPVLAEWLAGEGLLNTSKETVRAIRRLALRQGLSEYHLPSVDRSGMAFGLEVRPPYLDNDLVDYVVPLDESVLIDRTGRWTKLPLRRIARRLLPGPATERVSVRRKRAMPCAVEQAARKLIARLQSNDRHFGLAGLLRDLFVYLFIDPGVTTPPDLDLVEFAAECAGSERRA